MRRGTVVWVDLDPARNAEADKVRPAVIVSNDTANLLAQKLGRGTVTVVPVTSSVRTVLDFQVFVPKGIASLREDSKVQCEQVRAVSVERILDPVGRLPFDYVRMVDHALTTHLDLA